MRFVNFRLPPSGSRISVSPKMTDTEPPNYRCSTSREYAQVRTGPKTGSSLTHSAEMADFERQDTPPGKAVLLSKIVHVPHRSHDGNRKAGAFRKITLETHSVAPQKELAHPRISREKHSDSRRPSTLT